MPAWPIEGQYFCRLLEGGQVHQALVESAAEELRICKRERGTTNLPYAVASEAWSVNKLSGFVLILDSLSMSSD